MQLECHFARGAWSDSEREALAARIEAARGLVAEWLRSGSLDPEALAIADPLVAVVYPAGPPSHVDYRERRVLLQWPEGRDPPLVHEFVHAFGPPPAGTPGEEIVREGLATHLQSVLSDDAVFPFGRAKPAELLARFAPSWPPPRGELETPFEQELTLRFRACALGAVLVARALEIVPPRVFFEEVLGRGEALAGLERALRRSIADLLAPPLADSGGDLPIPIGAEDWLDAWRLRGWLVDREHTGPG